MRNAVIAAVLVIAVVGTAGIEYLIISPYVTGQVTVTTTEAAQSGRPSYESSNVSIAVGCCPSLPPEFVVGDPRTNTYVFDVSYGPILPIGHGSTITMVSGENMSIRVYKQVPAYPPNTLPLEYQWANFTVAGTFNPYQLFHQNATLFDGAVFMSFYVYQSVLYLRITTR